jgi:hypothetical protein
MHTCAGESIGGRLAHYTPSADLVTPQFAPQVFVSAFSWDGATPRLAEAVSALPHGSKVTAHIGSLQFDRRNNLRLRYRILPEQPSWRESRTLDLALGTLSSGAHTLEVQGRVFTGPWSGTANRSFTVLRPIGLTWPLLAGYFLVAASLAAGGYLLHRRHQAEEAELLVRYCRRKGMKFAIGLEFTWAAALAEEGRKRMSPGSKWHAWSMWAMVREEFGKSAELS